MQYTQLGRTGLTVSRICLGTMNFGPNTTEPDSFAIMDKALEVGVNFVDTANRYGIDLNNRIGVPKNVGLTEQIIGRWCKQGSRRREQIVLATKCFGPMGPGPNDRGLSAYHIQRACDDSLQRLQLDHIDLYQMHHVERTTPWDEIWQAMEQLVQSGKISYVGSSNFAAWDIVKANEAAAQRHFLGIVCEQSKYSLATRMIELELIPACRNYGVGVIAWSPLEGGMLGGVLKDTQKIRRSSGEVRNRIERHQSQLEAYEALCSELGEEPSHVALAWMLANPVMTGPIIGPRTIEQFTGCLRSVELELDDRTMQRLDEIWPGPGGEAPMAYAW